MPKVPVDYSQTCIYKLVHKDDIDNENIYIGSTTNFRKRKNEHKSRISKEENEHYNQIKYQYIRDNGGWDNWLMIEIEKYPCNDKREAETRERYWVEHYKSSLNSLVPTRSKKEYRQDNREMISEQHKQYRQLNRDKIAEKLKQKVTCECGCEVSKKNTTRHRKTPKHQQLMEQLNQAI